MTESPNESHSQGPNQLASVDLGVGAQAFVLSGTSRSLVEALSRKSAYCESSIAMYLEALRAMWRNDSGECLHVAAYEFREFMDSIPSALDLPSGPSTQLIGKAQDFAKNWKQTVSLSQCKNDGKWEGEIDRCLRDGIKSCETFAGWVVDRIPARKAATIPVLQKLAPTDDPLPPALMQARVDEWSALLSYFNYYAHHNGDPDPVDFTAKADRLATFLLEHLEPRTFEDQDQIDQLIEEAEA